MRRATALIAVVLMTISASGVALPQPIAATAGAGSAPSTTGIRSPLQGGPGPMQPCGVIGPYAAEAPPHPYRLGDPVCDGRGHGVAQPGLPHHTTEWSPVTAHSHGPALLPANGDSGIDNQWAYGADAGVIIPGALPTTGLYGVRQ